MSLHERGPFNVFLQQDTTATPYVDVAGIGANIAGSVLILFLSNKLMGATTTRAAIYGVLLMALFNTGFALFVQGILQRAVFMIINSITVGMVTVWAVMREQLKGLANLTKKAKGKADNNSVKVHYYALWRGQPQIMAFWEMVLQKERWKVALSNKTTAEAKYNAHKAIHDILHPSERAYAASKIELSNLLTDVSEYEVTYLSAQDRYAEIRKVYMDACVEGVFKANTHSSFYMKLNNAGSNSFHSEVRKEFGELTYHVVKDIVARMARNEIEETDLKAASAPAPVLAIEDDAPAPASKKQRAASASK